jgi:CDP-paratose 2-epimerase
MRILVTGGAGFIGTNVCLKARERGHEVIAMDSLIRRDSEENLSVLKNAGCEVLRGDVRNATDFQRSPIPDAIIHLAGNPGIPWSLLWSKYDFDVNAMGTMNVLEYARVMQKQVGHKIPVIYASTNKVYTDELNKLETVELPTRYELKYFQFGFDENSPIDGHGIYGHSPYGVSKLTGDLLCQEYNLAFDVYTVINRMSCIYGLFQKGVEDQGWIDWFIRQIVFDNGRLNIYGDGKQVRDMLWGEDVAELYLLEAENAEKFRGSVFNVGGGKDNTLSLVEAIKIIEDETGKKAELKFYPWRHADQRVYITDIKLVKSVTGWEPKVSPEQGIQRMIESYEKNK